MARGMDDRLAEIESRYAQVEAEMAKPKVASDPDRLRDLGKAYAALGEIVGPFRDRMAAATQAAEARERARDGADAEINAYRVEEVERLDAREADLRAQLEAL